MLWKFLGMKNSSARPTTGYPEVTAFKDCVLATHTKEDVQPMTGHILE